MRKGISLIFAGIVGGLIAIFGSHMLTPQEISQTNRTPQTVLTAANPNAVPFDFVLAAQKTTPAVVHIEAEESRALAQQRRQERSDSPRGFFDLEDFFGQNFHMPKNGTGSGVIISNDGYIVTNNHVVEYADIINVSLSDKRIFKAVKIGTDPSTDLALLKIEASDLVSAKFADSDKVKVGEWVAAVGNPFGYLESTVTAGIVSAKGRDIDIIKPRSNRIDGIQIDGIEEFIQTDAAINPGNSGGALVDVDGNLIGINTAIATPTGVYAGYSFAIPSNLVIRIIEDIKVNGNIERGRLGVQGFEVTEELVNERGLTIEKGFYVEKVLKGSGAQFAGVLPGDVIIEANGKNVDTFDDLFAEIEFAKVGDKIKLGIIRKNKDMNITVNLKKGI